MDSVDLHTEVAIFISLKGDNDGSHGLKVYHGSRGARDSRYDIYVYHSSKKILIYESAYGRRSTISYVPYLKLAESSLSDSQSPPKDHPSNYQK